MPFDESYEVKYVNRRKLTIHEAEGVKFYVDNGMVHTLKKISGNGELFKVTCGDRVTYEYVENELVHKIGESR